MSRSSDLTKLFDELDALKFTVKATKKGHYMIFDPSGRAIYTMSGTGGRGRGDTNATVALRKHMHAWRNR